MDFNLESIPIEIEGVNFPSIPGTSKDPIVEDDILRNSDNENSDQSDVDDDDDDDEGDRKSHKEISKLSSHLKDLMGEANIRFARGDNETAEKMCFEIIRQEPHAYEPYETLSEIYETINVEKYKSYLILANGLAPTNEGIACKLAEVYEKEGKDMEAIKCYSRGIKVNPRAVQFHELRLKLLIKNDSEKLIKLIRQHPPIYSAQLDSYRDENLKDNIWTNIAESINKTGFCTQDVVAIQMCLQEGRNKTNIIACSAYFPGDTDTVPPPAVSRLIDYSKRNKLQLIMGCDANSHHTSWGSTNINHRDFKKGILSAKKNLANHLPKKEHQKIIQFVMEVAKEYFNQEDYIRAIGILKIPLRRIPQKVTKDVINTMLELLLISERYSECLDIFTKFCDCSFDLNLNENNCIVINSYEMPDNIEIDLKMKFIVCLIKLRSCPLLFQGLINQVITEYDVEVLGDIYLDLVEALMQSNFHSEALKLLVPLVKSKNFSEAAVWLKYADCLAACEMPEQAIEAYFTVKNMAPNHVEMLYPLAMLLLQQNKRDEALEVMSQDLSSNRLNVAVLIEKLKLLRQIEDWENYWESAELLLSRHSIVFRNREEYSVITRRRLYVRLATYRKIRMLRGENHVADAGLESIRAPTVEEEYKLYREILQLAMDRREYALLQKFACMGLCSKRFTSYYNEIILIAFYACYFNKDVMLAYSIVKEILVKYPDNNLSWNLFSLATSTSLDIRHLKYLQRNSDNLDFQARECLRALYNISNTHYSNPLTYFTKQIRNKKTAYSVFMLGIAMLQYYCSRITERTKKKVLAETITYLFLNYAKLRSKKVEQEIFYNLGRMYQHLGVIYLAEHYYKKVLNVKNELLVKHPNILGLKEEAAYNLHIIYKNSGNFVAARKILYEYIVI